MNYYISDLHIGHENILRFDNRPFADVNEMNNKLIENWNARVRSDDTVYILGDFIWAKESEWPSIVGSLGGNKVLMVEHGELGADAFMAEISLMVNELVKTYSAIKGAEVLFPSGRDVVGKCPRCGGNVTESKKGFFCETNACRFGLWRDNKFLTAKKITPSKNMAAALLKDGEIPVKGIFSEKTGKSYDATLVLNDDGVKTVYSLNFGKK